jgi:hypothetical protein
MGKRSRRRAKEARINLRDGPFIELRLSEDAEPYEIAPGVMAMNLELRAAQAGGGITEIRPQRDGGIAVTTGRPLLGGAAELLAAGEPSAAVTAAHTASETYVRYVLDLWAAARNQPGPKRLQSYAFYGANKGLVAAYETLSGDRALRREQFWTSGRLAESARQRNRVVHSGYICSDDEARATIETLNQMHSYLADALKRVGIRTSSDDDG